MPYDRPATTMADFTLCKQCEAEYRSPSSRRFHAEPVACPACGPQLELRYGKKPPVHGTDKALAATVAALRAGEVVAIKGIGGYHLVCDARNDQAIQQLRAAAAGSIAPNDYQALVELGNSATVLFQLGGGQIGFHRTQTFITVEHVIERM